MMVYSEKYVAFIDILGFSDLVCNADQNIEKLETIIESIDRLKNTACDDPDTETITTYFSDCILISSSRTAAGLHNLLESTRVIAENLLQIDILIRGGFAVGNIHHSPEGVFGPAMIEAYNLESDLRGHPRIIASNRFWMDVTEIGESAEKYFIYDDSEPACYYFHYLRAYAEYRGPVVGSIAFDLYAPLVRYYIAKRIETHKEDERKFKKAIWLERYWNETVAFNDVLDIVDRVKDLQRPTDITPYRTKRMILANSA